MRLNANRAGATRTNRGLRQDGLIRSQILLNGLDEIDGIGDAEDVGFAQFVMHQQFANHSHSKISFRHPPELPGGQRKLNNASRRRGLLHGEHYPSAFDYSSFSFKTGGYTAQSRTEFGSAQLPHNRTIPHNFFHTLLHKDAKYRLLYE